MRTKEKPDRGRLIKAAIQQIPCDLSIENVQLVNTITAEIYPASVDVLDGRIVRVRANGEKLRLPSRETVDGGGRYLLPGFVDAHMHVESSMMLPEYFGREAVTWGTTCVFTDPHEIGNVMGIPGIELMLENGRRCPLRHYVLAPSCVPAVPGLESTGAVFTAKEIGSLLDLEGVVGIAELMDYKGVIRDADRMRSIIEEGLSRGLFLQGHAPGIAGKEIAAYRLGGPMSDHESASAEELREKLRSGYHINLRATQTGNFLNRLLPGLDGVRALDFVSFCTDDVHAANLMNCGHMNSVVSQTIRGGLDPADVVKMATLNAAREYGFEDLGALAPGYLADMQLTDDLTFEKKPCAVWVGGKLAAREGTCVFQEPESERRAFPNTVDLPQLTSPDDFRLRVPKGSGPSVRTLILVSMGGVLLKGSVEELPAEDGFVGLAGRDDLQYICIANRFGSGAKTIAVLKNFGLKEGAIASTVSHDSHNLTVIYRNYEDAYLCAKTLQECGGGICAVSGGKVLYNLPLPVAGLMSTLPCEELAPEIEKTDQAIKSVCDNVSPVVTVSLLALPVRPGLIITDLGIVDGDTQTFLDMFPE